MPGFNAVASLYARRP